MPVLVGLIALVGLPLLWTYTSKRVKRTVTEKMNQRIRDSQRSLQDFKAPIKVFHQEAQHGMTPHPKSLEEMSIKNLVDFYREELEGFEGGKSLMAHGSD